VNESVTAEDFQSLLQASGLDAQRPANDLDRLNRMLRGSDLVLTARLAGKLVGIGALCHRPQLLLLPEVPTTPVVVYDNHAQISFSDLAVDKTIQGSSVGEKLVEQVRTEVGPEVSLILLSAPGAIEYASFCSFESWKALLPGCTIVFMIE